MLLQIEKNIKTIENDKEKDTLYIVFFTDLYAPFVMSRYSVYGEEILKEVKIYDNDFLKVGKKESLNSYYYTVTERDEQLSSNYTIWKNGVKIYENLEEKYQIKGEEDIPIYGENNGMNTGINAGRITIPTHPIEDRSVEMVEGAVVRTDNSHYFYRKLPIMPFASDVLTFKYNLPDSQVFPGYNNAQELTQNEYNLLKNNPEELYESEETVYKIKETGEFYHLSSNGKDIIETHLTSYQTPPIIGTYGGYRGSDNDFYDRAYSLFDFLGSYNSGVGLPTYNIIGFPQTAIRAWWMHMYRDALTNSWTARNNNLSLFKSMRGYKELGRFLSNSSAENPGWVLEYDGGFLETIETSYAFQGAANTSTYSRYTQNLYHRFDLLPDFYVGSRLIRNLG